VKSTVEKFASELSLPVDLLLEQLKGAGVKKLKAEDELLENDKAALLKYLKKEHGSSPTLTKSKITLNRKQNTEIRKTDSDGRARTIQVEVRKKRTIVKPEQQKSNAEISPSEEKVTEDILKKEAKNLEVVDGEKEIQDKSEGTPREEIGKETKNLNIDQITKILTDLKIKN